MVTDAYIMRLAEVGRDVYNKYTALSTHLWRDGDKLTRHGWQLRNHPRVHGNGFVQLDLEPDGSRRLHIWGHPAVPQQISRTPVHDHIFSMVSEVLVGRLVNINWRLAGTRNDPPTHEVFSAYYDETGKNSELRSDGVFGRLEQHKIFSIGEYCHTRRYLVPAGELHSSVTDGPAATVMTKVIDVSHRSRRPRVLVPVGQQPDNAFDRSAHDPNLLWGIINEVYPRWPELLQS